MWNSLRISGRGLTRFGVFKKIDRTFLSEAYRCTDAWNKRLESPLLRKVNSIDMFYALDQQFQNIQKASAVDVDIYANVITGDGHTDELIDLLHKLRLCPEATNILDSTHHAVIRYLFDNDEITDLLTVLHDRINYGIFPDHLCYNILMDSFLKKEDFASAAKIAVLLMLQEDSSNPICNALALYSCHKYLESPEGWKAPEPEPEEDPKGEVIKVRVKYIINPYFDDHFDLKDPNDLVGKTLVFYGKKMKDVTGRSCHLRGLVLWKKYKDASNLINEWIKSGQQDCVYRKVLAAIKEHVSALPKDKITDEVKELQELLNVLDEKNLKEGDILEDIENRLKDAVSARAENDISEACENYKKWEQTRMSLLEAQLVELDKQARLEKVDSIKDELKSRERLLTFFENQEKIDLQIEEKHEREEKLYGKPRKMSKEADDDYVPPEIVKRRTH